MRLLKFGVGVACLVFLSGLNSFAQDWSQWRGDNGDGVVSGFVAPEVWPDELEQVWTVEVGEGDASPSLVDGRLYVFSRQEDQEILRCLEADNGKVLWESMYDSIELRGAASRHSGPRSSPAVAEGKVVTLGVGGVLSCFDADSGEVLWRKHEGREEHPDYYTSASPIILDGVCVAQIGGRESGFLVAHDLAEGRELWRWEGDPPAYASPSVMTVEGDKQIVTLTNNNLVGISAADGDLLWTVPYAVPRMSTNSATPVVSGQTVIYSAQNRGVNAIRIEKTEDGYAVNPLWTNDDLSTAFNSPVLVGDHLFGISYRTNLYCLDMQTGKPLWIDEATHERFGTVVAAGSTLFALPSNGILTAYELSGDGYSRLGQYKVSDSPTYSYPVVSGNRVYV